MLKVGQVYKYTKMYRYCIFMGYSCLDEEQHQIDLRIKAVGRQTDILSEISSYIETYCPKYLYFIGSLEDNLEDCIEKYMNSPIEFDRLVLKYGLDEPQLVPICDIDSSRLYTNIITTSLYDDRVIKLDFLKFNENYEKIKDYAIRYKGLKSIFYNSNNRRELNYGNYKFKDNTFYYTVRTHKLLYYKDKLYECFEFDVWNEGLFKLSQSKVRLSDFVEELGLQDIVELEGFEEYVRF